MRFIIAWGVEWQVLKLFIHEAENLTDGLIDTGHEILVKAGQRAAHKAAVIDSSKLVNDKVRVLGQAT